MLVVKERGKETLANRFFGGSAIHTPRPTSTPQEHLLRISLTQSSLGEDQTPYNPSNKEEPLHLEQGLHQPLIQSSFTECL